MIMSEEMRRSIMDCFKHPDFRDLLQNEVRAAMAEVLQKKDEEIKELKDELNKANIRINEIEQYSRRKCINIDGVRETEGENTDDKVIELARLAGVTLEKTDIDRSHRIGEKKGGRERPIIVRLESFSKRQELYGARRNLRNDDVPSSEVFGAQSLKNVFVSDNLTKSNQETMYHARKMKKEGKIHAAWTDVGRMKIRLTERGQTKIIRSTEHLYEIAAPDEWPGSAPEPRDRAADTGVARPDRPVTRSRGGKR